MAIQLPDFTSARILVVGDVILDRYWFGDTSRVSREAPIPVVKVRRCEEIPGGASNAAVNIAALGGQVTLLGLVGEDEAASVLERLLDKFGVDCRLIHIPDISTIVKLRAMSQNHQVARLDFEETFEKGHDLLLQLFEEELTNVNMVVLSDYGNGTLRQAKHLIALAKRQGVPVVVDPRNPDFELYRGATVIKPNFSEFQSVAGHCIDETDINMKVKTLMNRYDIQSLLLTQGKEGMTLFCTDPPDSIHISAVAREVFDITGAGDTVIAVLAATMAAGFSLLDATRVANIAAGIVVSKLGNATVRPFEIQQVMDGMPTGVIVSEEQLMAEVNRARAYGEKIVMTNGCFDILHSGHVQYLEKAKQFGDRLIVAVNDDEAVFRLKGKGRPVNALEKRMSVLAGLKAVDWVISFPEDTAERLIQMILPNVYVKGGDYRVKELPEAKWVIEGGGEIQLIDLVEGCSTTSLIENIQNNRGTS